MLDFRRFSAIQNPIQDLARFLGETLMRNRFMSCKNVLRFAVAGLLFAGSAGLIPARAAAADDAISIGVVLPITGKEGKPGQYQREGIDTAVKKKNYPRGSFFKDKGKKMTNKKNFLQYETEPSN